MSRDFQICKGIKIQQKTMHINYIEENEKRKMKKVSNQNRFYNLASTSRNSLMSASGCGPLVSAIWAR